MTSQRGDGQQVGQVPETSASGRRAAPARSEPVAPEPELTRLTRGFDRAGRSEPVPPEPGSTTGSDQAASGRAAGTARADRAASDRSSGREPSTEPDQATTHRSTEPTRAAETDPARRALSAAKAAAGRRAKTRTNRPVRRRVAGEGPTGSGPDDRDPQPLGPLVRGLFTERGWNPTASAAGVMERWPALVGPDVASHARPVSLRDGELVVEATSTAWATQLRLLTPRILAALARDVGPSVVTRMRVNGPAGPSWRRGPLRVTGPGPRDTYG